MITRRQARSGSALATSTIASARTPEAIASLTHAAMTGSISRRGKVVGRTETRARARATAEASGCGRSASRVAMPSSHRPKGREPRARPIATFIPTTRRNTTNSTGQSTESGLLSGRATTALTEQSELHDPDRPRFWTPCCRAVVRRTDSSRSPRRSRTAPDAPDQRWQGAERIGWVWLDPSSCAQARACGTRTDDKSRPRPGRARPRNAG